MVPAPEVVLARGAAALAELAPPGDLALAVSGGADSLALLLTAEAWAGEAGCRLHVLTVDHGFRAESAAEAAAVAELARARGHEGVVLRPDRPLSRQGLEAAARAARYGLMTRWCRDRGVGALATGHSRDDQAETLLLRLQRGSGLDGLSAMAPETRRDGIRLLRPLLGLGRAELAALVDSRGLAAVDDPMNHDPRFRRVALRRAIADLGIDVAGLAATAGRLGRDRAAIATAVDDLARRAFTLSPWGIGRIDPAGLSGPAPFVERALARLIRAVGGHEHPPRRDRLERLAARLVAARDGGFPGSTLGGCRFLAARGMITVLREARDIGPDLRLDAGASGVWDNRFRVTAGAMPVTIAPLGTLRPLGLPDCPAAERRVMPAVFSQGGLIAVPPLEFGAPLAAQLRYCAANML